MSTRLIDFLLPLSPRERILLGISVFVVLPLAVIFGLLLPLSEARTKALQMQTEAIALDDWVTDRAAEMARLDAAIPAQPSGPPIGLAGLEKSLISAQLRGSVSTIGARADGGIELVFDQVDFRRLANWLSASHPNWGYAVENYRFDGLEQPGKITASVLLSAR